MRVPYIDLGAQYRDLKPAIDSAISRVMESGRYIGGAEVHKFEESMAEYLGVRHVVAVGNGYDAIFLTLKAMAVGAGESVWTDEYTHVSTHAAIVATGAKVRFEYEQGVNLRLPVHMNGRMQSYVRHADLPVVEDACQALGAKYKGQKVGTFGAAGCFSLHPMKVLGCAGDGGFVCTNLTWINNNIRRLRNHGESKGYGVNSRLDNLQAAILNVKMKRLDWYIERRREIALAYETGLRDDIKKPPPPSDGDYFDVYSSYVLQAGSAMQAHLESKGVEAFSHIRADRVSLPIYPEMTGQQVDYVIDAVNSF